MSESWLRRLERGTLIILVGFLSFAFAPLGVLAAENAIITKGTLLRSETPITVSAIPSHPVIGYLPVGTRIVVGRPVTLINLSQSVEEGFYAVTSSLGISGLVRHDRFVRIKRHPIAVSISDFQIRLHRPDATQITDRGIFLGRYLGNYLEIVGDNHRLFYDAILHRSESVGSLPESEPVRLWKRFVQVGLVVVVDVPKPSAKAIKMPKWSKDLPLDNVIIQKVSSVIKNKIGLKNVEAFFRDIHTLQCRLTADASAGFGFKIFNNGLEFNLGFAFKEKDHAIVFQMFKLVTSKRTETYTVLRNVICDGFAPERLIRITIQEGAHNPNKRITQRLKDLERRTEKWTISMQGSRKAFKMITVNGWNEYKAILQELEGRATGSADSYLSQVSPIKRELLLNFIIAQIAHFEQGDLYMANVP